MSEEAEPAKETDGGDGSGSKSKDDGEMEFDKELE
jgi:hypothetical protein